MKKILIFLLLISLFFPYSLSASEPVKDQNFIKRPLIKIFNTLNYKEEFQFYPFTEDSKALGANITSADLDNDNLPEIIVATGRNEKPFVRIFNHQGEFLYEFLAYPETFTEGFKVIVADLYNDGSPEIITAPNEGGGAQIRVFDNLGFIYFSFFAFDESLRNGANVAVGDVNNDSRQEFIVTAGSGSEPVVKIFDIYTNFLTSFYAYEKSFTGGVNVLTANIADNPGVEIITAPLGNKESTLKFFNYSGQLLNQFLAYPAGFIGGVNLAQFDAENDNKIEILTGAGFGGASHIRIFDNKGQPKVMPNLFAFDNFQGGVSVAVNDLDNDGASELIAATQTISSLNKYDAYKIIEIDLRKQKLFAYYKGELVKEFIVSTGKWKYPTPTGNFKVYSKVPSTTMKGYYGPNHPDNYNLPNVPSVMSFYKGYAIHGAYWHWKFGTRVSHGCINLKLPDAKWLYEWSVLGTPIKIYSSPK